ncbi:HesA/MoeB/ThiF family protein [Acinetobacter qingfengensis]|uniref:Molybdopterin biosynthesis protein n=1 Tax=Acinetobacter qingfengensis TaxID=1262585 RepID=A0A1E7RFG2_9GAMM|nr:HesA/MoeB/ThiF family protein [Acinetobacter qingfengensis]KAA8735659.1 HesA/MoeB/ThiF family protein [Acinetobacter qingfengensis]OEY97895.1 molybdopterin biosynthesis protein [Acinetobacter qingfengensis]
MLSTNHPSTLSNEELKLYSRHVLLDDWDIDAQEKLKSSRVLIIGAGGIGCTCAELLARAGVGHISIVDFDHIETSNLQRQIAFTLSNVGHSKVITLALHLKNINSNIDIHPLVLKLDQNTIKQLNTNYDLVLDGCDNFATRYLVNSFCLEHQLPLLSAAAIGYEGQLLFVRYQPCYQCIFNDTDQDDERRCANSGVLTTTPVIMASLQAHHALLYLGLGQAPLLNKLLLWNGLNMTQRILKIQADPNCYCADVYKNTT